MVFSWLARRSSPTRTSAPRRGRDCRRPTAVPRVECLEDRDLPSVLIPVTNHRDLVYDPTRNNLDITTTNGALQVFNLTTQTLQTQPVLYIGYNLGGADLAADGNTLLVADQGPANRQLVHRFNLQTYQESDFNFPPYAGSGAAWDLAMGPGTTGLFDDSSSAAAVRLEQFDDNSGALTFRTDAPGSKGPGLIGPGSLIHRSADRSLFLIADTGSPNGALFTYNALTNTFSHPVSLGVPLAGATTAVSRNGNLMAVQVAGSTFVLNRNLQVVNRLGGLDGGVAFDPSQDVMYAVASASGQIVAFNTNTWQVLYQMPTGETVPHAAPLGNGTMLVTPNGWLFLATPSGVRGYQLPPPPGTVASFAVSPTTAIDTAGGAVQVTVTALDANGNPMPYYNGTVHLSTTDLRTGSLPDYTFNSVDRGTHTFTIPFYTAGAQTVNVVDANNANAKDVQQPYIKVQPGPTAFFGSIYYGNSTYGEAVGYSFPLYLQAQDRYNNITPAYTGTVHFTSSDSAAQLPADYTFTANDQGVHRFDPVLNTAGYQSITITPDSPSVLTQQINNIQVTDIIPGLHFTVTAATATPTAGTPFGFTVTALDYLNQVATRYHGTVTFALGSTSGAGGTPPAGSGGTLPADYTFTPGDAGVHTFGATLVTAGSQTIGLRDTTWVTGAGIVTTTYTVLPAAASTFQVRGFPAAVTAGTRGNFTVTAFDPYGNVATGYAGTVHVSSSDGQAALAADATLTNGTGVFGATLKTAGAQSLTASDSTNAALTGSESGIAVSPGAAAALVLSGPSSVTAGAPFGFSVTADDAYGNVATGYAGTVHFRSSDSQAALPADATLTNGAGTFSATLKTAGSAQFLTATDTANAALTGTQSGIAAAPSAASSLVVNGPSGTTAGAPFTFSVTAYDPYGNVATGYGGTVHFSSSDAGATLPADATLVNGTGTFSATLTTAGSQSLTATDTANPALAGTDSAVAVSPAAAAVLVLSGPSSATAGAAYTFTVTAYDAYGNVATGYTGTVHFSTTDAAAGLPADYTFSAGDVGTATFTTVFNTVGNQTLTASDISNGLSTTLGVLVVSA